MKAAKKQTNLLLCREGFFKKTPRIHIGIEIKGVKRLLPCTPLALHSTLKKILKKEHIRSAHLTIVLASNAFVKRLNKKFLLKDSHTDCLAFDLKPKTWAKDCLFGDIVVSVDMAYAVSRACGFSFKEELLRYIVHGILHLTGFNDISQFKRKQMWKRQEELLFGFVRYLK